jgi:hypothetical protein
MCKEYERGEDILVCKFLETMFLNSFMHMLEVSHIIVVDMEGRHGEKFLGHQVLQCPSMEIRFSCVYVLLIFSICLTFQSGSLKTTCQVPILGYMRKGN